MGAIRLFLALAVLQSHLIGHFVLPGHAMISGRLTLGITGSHAVALFFVVSGFLIGFVLEEKYDRPGGSAAFYRARALRIYPLWWCLYLIVPLIGDGGLWGFIASRRPYDLVSGFFIFGSDWLLSFKDYPQSYTLPMPHGLELGWTLASELTFYLIAPFVLRSRRWPAMILGGSVLLRIWLVALFPHNPAYRLWENWCYYFFPSTAFLFMLGHYARQLHKLMPLSPAAAWCTLGVAALICLIQDDRYQLDNADFLIAMVLFAAALPAIFEATKDNRTCNFLGDLTYPLYLSHGVLIMMIETRAPWLPEMIFTTVNTLPGVSHRAMVGKTELACVILWIPALLVAIAVHFLLEKPATRALRTAVSLFDPYRRPATRGTIAP